MAKQKKFYASQNRPAIARAARTPGTVEVCAFCKGLNERGVSEGCNHPKCPMRPTETEVG